MSAKRRIQGQPIAADADDRFVASTMELTAWASKHRQQVIVGIGAAIVLVASAIYYVGFRTDMDIQAVNELDEIQQTLALGDPVSATGRLNQFIDRYSGSSAEMEARLVLGQLHLQESQPAEAVTVLSPMARDLNNPLGLQGAFLLAAGYEDMGRFDEAEGLYIRIANQAELEFQVRDALDSAARIRVSQGNFAGAQVLLEEILDGMEPSDPGRAVIEMRVSELEQLQRTA